jgi:hypothetical protein
MTGPIAFAARPPQCGHQPLSCIEGVTIALPKHIAFRVSSRATVDAFYRTAITAGGKDNGAPGPRPQDQRNYYGTFVIDPDGHNIAAVCHESR